MLRIFATITAGLLFMSGLAGLTSSVHASDNASIEVSQDQMQRMSPKDLKGLLDKGETVLIVDVRSVGEFNKQHIAGAMSVPLSMVESQMVALPSETNIVFY